MTITKEVFVDLQEKFERVTKLIEEESKSDPENEPFLSKYTAKQILIGMKANIENLLRNYVENTPEHTKISGMLSVVYLYLGTVLIETEDLLGGEKYLDKCNSIIESYYLKPEIISVSVSMFNQFGLIWSQRDPEKAKIYLEQADKLYLEYKNESLDPIGISDLFQANLESYDTEDAKLRLEKIHTYTLYYFAQIYGNLKDALKSSVYCHITIQRQYTLNDYEPIDWALNAATLSQFFMEANGFKQARHHLAASSFMIAKYEDTLNAITEKDEAYEAKMEVFKHRSADVARCWSKYGLLLLQKSKERLLAHTDDIDVNCSLITDLSKLQLSPSTIASKDDLQQLTFEGIDLSLYENQVTDQFVLTLEDARKVFLNIQMWCNKAIEYYNLNNLASDYIEIVQDQSQMYLHLLFFDDSPENQAKLHKRRVDLLENVLSEVNPQYYLQYCRQIWFELAETYFEIYEIKSDKLKQTVGRPKPQQLLKINNLIDKCVSHYENFINSFIENSTGELPKKIPEEAEKAFLMAHFHIAGLHNKYISMDKQKQLGNIELTIKYYKKLVNYCDQFDKAKEMLKVEYGIAKELVTLLPIKVHKLKQEI